MIKISNESKFFIKESVDISAVKRLLGVTEDNEVVSDFRYDDDLSKLKKDLKALGMKKVGIIPAKYGFKDSLYAYDGTGPYSSEFSLEISPLKNDREYEIKFSRLRTTESARLSESSSDEVEDFEDFKKKCQANPTYKKAAAIAKKYGYRIADACYVDVAKNGNKFISFNVAAVDRRSYHPEIYYNAKYGNNYEFEIQTTAYGSMDLEEHTKFIKGVTDAHNMVAELSELDLTTLYETPMDE